MRAIYALPVFAIVFGAVAGFVLPIDDSEAQQGGKCARYERTLINLENQAGKLQTEIEAHQGYLRSLPQARNRWWSFSVEQLNTALEAYRGLNSGKPEDTVLEAEARYLLTMRTIGLQPDLANDPLTQNAQRMEEEHSELQGQLTGVVQARATVRDNMNTLGCDRIPGQRRTNEPQMTSPVAPPSAEPGSPPPDGSMPQLSAPESEGVAPGRTCSTGGFYVTQSTKGGEDICLRCAPGTGNFVWYHDQKYCAVCPAGTHYEEHRNCVKG